MFMQVSLPLVSVHMITYNHVHYIQKAIDSILNQKIQFSYELVIGEDCSNDGTKEIVEKYENDYPGIIRVVASDRNVGMKANFIRTLNACKGKYVAFCEGDDFWHCDKKMAIQTNYLEQNPECGLVFSDYDWYFSGTNKRVENYHSVINKKIHSPQLIDIVSKKVDIRTCTVQAKRELLIQIINNDTFLHQSNQFKMCDIPLWAEISTLSNVCYIEKSLATYQIIENSATQSKDVGKRLLFSINDCEMYLYLCRKYNLPKQICQQHEEKWKRESLIYGFNTKNTVIADSVKKKGIPFSIKDWLWYMGIKNSIIRKLLKVLLLFK